MKNLFIYEITMIFVNIKKRFLTFRNWIFIWQKEYLDLKEISESIQAKVTLKIDYTFVWIITGYTF